MIGRMRVVRCIVGGALVLSAGAAWSASFDCKQAGTPVERRLCAVPALGQLDDQLDEAYRGVLDTAPRDSLTAVRDQQRAWLRQRNACAQDAKVDDCLRRSLKARVDALGKILDAQQQTLDRIIASIPKTPADAARQCRATTRRWHRHGWRICITSCLPQAWMRRWRTRVLKAHARRYARPTISRRPCSTMWMARLPCNSNSVC